MISICVICPITSGDQRCKGCFLKAAEVPANFMALQKEMLEGSAA